MIGPVPLVPNAGPSGSGEIATTSPESRRLAGGRIVLSYRGLRPPEAALEMIRHGHAAGVIIFRENVSSVEQLADSVIRLKRAAAEAPDARPLLLMTDQEGGPVRRLPGGPETSARRAESGAGQGIAAAAALGIVGLNVNLAPVLDVFDSPGNFIDRFERSFAQDPVKVAELGRAFVVAQQARGVAATAKHFPGLGSAGPEDNTDERPVTLSVPLERLRQYGEEPYRAAIAAGVRLVMLSWAVYPALDPVRPAGLSRTVVGGELRGRLGFRGVTITDALEARALAQIGGTGARAVAAADAGMDVLLCSGQDPRQAEQAGAALALALETGRLDRRSFDEALSRIQELRTSLN
ncbi:beta-N-acetylhexosaminidase [Streptomyces sp. TLI_053]|uniref:glycoside hydrolase family 3 N-terminal domain-containing protein n=1 Tax=Streptomyces sp. TLI_053 TaxID=1855352 RepID=UPI00087B897B|nr:glycoside hydrolase family 3 N-terminal domain-containing protein [Streptomyces sp. TLI_053]SDT82714.1 beta-N-acetylhexosaminidase [Streptomyces sp. TLI_053]